MKKKLKSNATSNKTSVKEEKEKLLESAGVDTEEQYRNKLYLDQQKAISMIDLRMKSLSLLMPVIKMEIMPLISTPTPL